MNSPFVMFWVQMVKNHGIYCAFEKPVLKYKSYTLKWVFVTISGFRPHQLVAEKKGVAIMAVRILWDRYEVALLINIYERVTDGADIHSEAEKLSATLWSLAIRRGLSIDDTYRNVNGMKMQLANVQYLFTDGQKGLSGALSMTCQIYKIYRSNYTEYQTVLKGAIQLTKSNVSIEDAFFAYAKDRTGFSPDILAKYLKRATDYCHLKQLILGMTDVKTVRNVQQKVAGGRLLRFRYGKKAQTIRSATLLYYTFLKGYQEAKSEIPQQETLSEKVTFPVQSIPVADVAVVEPASEPQNAVFAEASEGDVSESVEAKADEVSEELYEDWIVHELRIRKIPYVDNRSLNGCLWIESDMSTPLPLNEAAKRGYRFRLKPDGCRAFPNHSVIWIKDCPKRSVEETPVTSIGKGEISIDAFRRFLIQEFCC